MKTITDQHRILIADDEPSIRIALRSTLESVGYEISEAIDGRSAIEALLAEPFDLVILDLSMPHIDGLEVLKELARVRGSNVPPALILTAYGSVSAAIDSARHGAVEFLHKPIKPETLRSAVQRAIDGVNRRPLIDRGDNYYG
jgi:DNA-binding NtrC family response regulator